MSAPEVVWVTPKNGELVSNAHPLQVKVRVVCSDPALPDEGVGCDPHADAPLDFVNVTLACTAHGDEPIHATLWRSSQTNFTSVTHTFSFPSLRLISFSTSISPSPRWMEWRTWVMGR